MATFQKYRRADGTTGFTAIIRIKGYAPARQAFDTKADAEAWARELERDLKDRRSRGDARADITTVTLTAIIERYLADPNTQALRSVRGVEQLLGYWANRLGALPMRTLGRRQIVEARDELLKTRPGNATQAEKTLAPGRVNRYLAALSACWNWAVAEGYARQPWPKGMKLTESKAKTVTATPDELAALFVECDAESPELGTLARFLVGTGARLGDALTVIWRDVSLKDREVTLGGKKTGKPYRVAMLPPAVDACTRAEKVRDLSGRVLWQWRNEAHPRTSWDRARERFPGHLRGIRMHDLRHVCASLLAASGASAVQLAAQLNHTSLQMVQRYAHLAPAHRGPAHDAVDELFSNGATTDRGRAPK